MEDLRESDSSDLQELKQLPDQEKSSRRSIRESHRSQDQRERLDHKQPFQLSGHRPPRLHGNENERRFR